MKKLLIVSIIAAILGSYIYFSEIPAAKKELFASKFFGDIASSEIEQISVLSSTGNYELINVKPEKARPVDPSKGVADSLEEKTSDLPPLNWQLADLKSAVLDRATVEGVAQTVAEASYSKKVDGPEPDLAVYGLTTPAATILVKLNGKDTKILLGDKNEFIDGRYAKIESDPTIYVVDDSLFSEVSKAKDVFRSQTPIAFSDSSVEQLQIINDGETIKIKPQPDKTFRIIEPINAKASNFAVFDLYRSLRNLQAERFIDVYNNLEEFGLSGKKQIQISRTNNQNLFIQFGIKDDNLYFAIDGQPTVYKAVGDPRNSVFKTVSSFRDAQPFKFDPYLGTSVTVTKDNIKILSLKSQQGSWEFAPSGTKADSPFVREFLKTLGDLTATNFMLIDDTKWANSASIKIDVEIDDDGKKSTKTLFVGHPQGDKGYPALVEGSNEPFFITSEAVKQITPAEEKFKIVPTPVPTAQVTVAP